MAVKKKRMIAQSSKMCDVVNKHSVVSNYCSANSCCPLLSIDPTPKNKSNLVSFLPSQVLMKVSAAAKQISVVLGRSSPGNCYGMYLEGFPDYF